MWILMHAMVVMVVGTAGVWAEGPHKPEAAERQAFTIITADSYSTPEPNSYTTAEPNTYTTAEPITYTTAKPIQSSARAVDCADHMMAGQTQSGVYEIYPFTCTCGDPVLVWCDMETDGGGWTVFLSRKYQTPQFDFNRTWDEYKAGFGSPHLEHYLGNELLHQMTYGRAYTIRLDLGLASGGSDSASYQSFKVNSESMRYSGYMSGSQHGDYATRRCLSIMNYRSFTTRDRDHDSYNGNCASVQGGGWWYYNCRYFNPTSTYNTTLNLTCSGSTSTSRSVTQLQLKLRPSICDSSIKTIHLKTMGCGCAAQDTTTTSQQTTTTTTAA